MREKEISIAGDFSKDPAGRYHPEDGPNTGERFRLEILVPALHKYDRVIVFFDNEDGYGSSFIDEAFGGLVREGYFSKDFLKEHLDFKAIEENQIFVEEALSDIKVATLKK